MNESLLAPFSADDVKKAAFSIGDLKAPGPDGLHAVFYKKFWDICGAEITQEVLQALNTGVIPAGWNDTTIVLIPKVDEPENITQFRPISLCNVIYKIISKMLAHRLKGILPDVISPMQSAFVPGRLITDNVLVAYECVHAIKNKRSGLTGSCAVKLDMHKAYDRVEWIFLESMMRRLGFAERWIGLMMACVTSVKYQVRFNSEETDTFIPTRGLRQGDPLSPYLFLLCAEGLSILLLYEEEVGGLDGLRVCRNAPSVSHLLFADDSLILMKADTDNATSLQQVLDTYCANSGQLVSLAKSSIYFSPNTNVLMRAEICQILHIDTEAISDKYLGLPALVGADKSDCFEHFIERIIQRINGWKEKMLSIGGKEILLKAVAQAISVYAMSVFLLPKGICKRMMDAISQFWWGDDENTKHMHWLAWWKLCYPKKEGGMGFRDFHSFNLAMLSKQVWRLIVNPESLCARVLRAKYYPNGDILSAGPKAGSSYTWQSIVASIATFKRGYLWRVGNGESIKIWSDPWIPSSPDRKVISPRNNVIYTKVSELISPVTGQWDAQLLHELFNQVDVARILRIPLNDQGFEDFIAWGMTSHGRYTVRSGYYLQWKHQFGHRAAQLSLPGRSAMNPVWKNLWRLKLPGKIKIFIWRSLHGIVPIKCILANRHVGTSGECPVCNLHAEDLRHLLFTCPVAIDMWQTMGIHEIIEDALDEDREGSALLENIINRADNSLQGFQSVNRKEVVLTASKAYGKKQSNIGDRWTRPENRQTKLNVDASYHNDSKMGAVGAVLRDFQGQFVAASTKVLANVESVTMAEAHAMKEGLSLAVTLGCNNVIAESDSIDVIQACTGADSWWSESSAIFADCVDMAVSIGREDSGPYDLESLVALLPLNRH
nr:uncharacterized protein LOC127339703 [Lolium perenne]